MRGNEGMLEQLSIAIHHITTHTTLHHQPTEGRVNNGVKGQKVNYFDLSFTVFGKHFQGERTGLCVCVCVCVCAYRYTLLVYYGLATVHVLRDVLCV